MVFVGFVFGKQLFYRPAACVHISYGARYNYLFAVYIGFGNKRFALLLFKFYAQLISNVARRDIAHIMKGF